MSSLKQRVNRLDGGGGEPEQTYVRIVVDEGEDAKAVAKAAGYDSEKHNLIVRKIIKPRAEACTT